MITSSLIKIEETENGTKTVLATQLYEILGSKTQFNHWIRRMLKYGFIEDVDFWTFLTKTNSGRPTKEYILSVDCAKSIAMIQRNEQGRKVREYFIEVEKAYKEIATPQQIAELYKKLNILEKSRIDFSNDWTVDRYLRVNGWYDKITNTQRQQFGKRCTKVFKEKFGKEPKKVQHPSFINGQNVYPYELINEVFQTAKKNNSNSTSY